MGFKCGIVGLAQCRQVDPVQRADPDGGGAGGELSVLHHRAQCRRRRGARSAARQAGGDRQIGEIIPTRSPSSTSPAWCAAPRRARGSATSFSPISARCDAVAHVLRCFEDSDVTHVEGRIDPVADIETVETELMLADLDSLEKRVDPHREERPRAATRKPRSSSRSGTGARAAARRQAGAPRELTPRRARAPFASWAC
jgi:ribosome-binding ATPase